MLCPVIGPVIGGIISEFITWRYIYKYAFLENRWEFYSKKLLKVLILIRWIFWILSIIGCLLFIVILFFLPETLRILVGNGSIIANPTPIHWLKQKLNNNKGSRTAISENGESKSNSHQYGSFPNPIRPILYLLEPDVFIALLFNALHYCIYYCYLTSMPSLLSSIYGLNELEVGLCFLVPGVGSVLGSFCEGRILDHDFKSVAKQHGLDQDEQRVSGKLAEGFPIFKARLRTAWVHAILAQAVTIIYGWCLYVNAHLAVALVLQFIGILFIYFVPWLL